MKRNNCFSVFPVTTFTIVLKTQQTTTGCEFNQLVPLNKDILVVVEFFLLLVILLTCSLSSKINHSSL